jgi:hydroxypyruvate isomerase
MLRFSANLGFLWVDRPLLERIDLAARAGFRAVELHFPYDTPADQVKAACARNRVKLLGVNTNVGGGANGHRGFGAVPGREAEFAALIDQSIAFQRMAGGTSIHAMAGFVQPSDRAAGMETMVANLAKAAPKAAVHGLTLLLEPLNQIDMPGYFYSEVERAAEIIDRVGAPNVKLMFDAYQVARAQGDVIRRLRDFYPKVGHFQIAGVPARDEPDRGEIFYPAVFAALEELGFDGWIGCEYRAHTTVEAGLSWLKGLGVSL